MPTPQVQPQEKLTFIKLNDFTPGIAENPGSNYPTGQAQRTNTYRCIANRQGALSPLPRRDFSLNGINYATPAAGYFLIEGFYIDPVPVLPLTGSSDPDGRYHNILLGVKYSNAGSETIKVELFRQYKNPVTNSTIKSASVTSADTVASGFGMSFVGQRINRTNVRNPGVPVVAYSHYSAAGGAMNFWEHWPNDTTPTSDTPFSISGDAGLLCSHQNRIINRLYSVYGNGTGGQASTTEDMKWTNANDSGIVSVSQVFYPEETNGYGIMASMTANELFMLKEQGGVMVSGDVENATVINLPMVVGTTIVQVPARSNIGLVYVTDSGVWAWAHGDTSQLLSPRMTPHFWRPTSIHLLGEAHKLQAWDDWIAVPNNWLYDSQLRSWWRLEDETVLQTQRYGRFRDFLYADLQTYTVVSPLAVVGWNRALKATSYSWQSQPLWVTVDRRVNVREISCRAVGTGTVDITVTAATGDTQTRTFTFSDATIPHMQRHNMRVQGSDLVVKIVSTGTGGNDAPTIDEIEIGVDQRQLAGVSG